MPADAARQVIADAIRRGVFPSATAEVGSGDGPIWQESAGVPFDTLFDLASLTKVMATTTEAMRRIADGTLRLDAPVAGFFGEWRGADRDSVTIRDLLEHASGLAARLVDAAPRLRREFEHDICSMPLEYSPRSKSIYSDLGFILLGFILDVGKIRLQPDLPPDLTFNPPAALRPRIAPTRPLEEDLRRGRVLVGEVHDHYAAALGGAAGHAGLFATATAVGAFARMVLRAARGNRGQPAPFTPERVAQFTTRSTVPGSSRALGWDTMLPTSSCGTLMSASAFGHVGYTGTSLWIDPGRDRYFVLLTNRAFGGGTLDEMRGVRRAFHDAYLR